MIIKSMGRKAAKPSGGGRGRGGSPFLNLVRYMTRGDPGEISQSVIWHGFYGHGGLAEEDIVSTFERNAKRLKDRKNGNVLYHEVLSFGAGYRLEDEKLARAVADIGQEYLRARAPNQLAFGAIHSDTEHIHLHLMISANEVDKVERVRLSKKEFLEIQRAIEAHVLACHPELKQTKIYDQERLKERLKTRSSEQAMKIRTGGVSDKEQLKNLLHGLFEQAIDREELERVMASRGMAFYLRGKTRGVTILEKSGAIKKHRLETLGVLEHYVATENRFTLKENQPSQRKDKTMVSQGNSPGMSWGTMEPTAPEIVAEEFLTGHLHENWHGKPEQPAKEPSKASIDSAEKTYSDDILKRIAELEKHKPSSKGTDKDRDDER